MPRDDPYGSSTACPCCFLILSYLILVRADERADADEDGAAGATAGGVGGGGAGVRSKQLHAARSGGRSGSKSRRRTFHQLLLLLSLSNAALYSARAGSLHDLAKRPT